MSADKHADVLNYVRAITDGSNNMNMHKITATCIAFIYNYARRIDLQGNTLHTFLY